jgi:hypothetical protein
MPKESADDVSKILSLMEGIGGEQPTKPKVPRIRLSQVVDNAELPSLDTIDEGTVRFRKNAASQILSIFLQTRRKTRDIMVLYFVSSFSDRSSDTVYLQKMKKNKKSKKKLKKKRRN